MFIWFYQSHLLSPLTRVFGCFANTFTDLWTIILRYVRATAFGDLQHISKQCDTREPLKLLNSTRWRSGNPGQTFTLSNYYRHCNTRKTGHVISIKRFLLKVLYTIQKVKTEVKSHLEQQLTTKKNLMLRINEVNLYKQFFTNASILWSFSSIQFCY